MATTPPNGKSGKTILGCTIGVVVLLAATTVAGFFFWTKGGYQPTVHRHVPPAVNIAIRADGKEIALFGPVRKHIWPILLDSKWKDERPQSERIKRIEKETGIDVPWDFREMIIASMDGTSWVAVVGGKWEPGRFVDGLHRVIEAEGLGGWKRDGEILVHQLGPAIGQADDGTLVFGTNADITRAALPVSEESATLPVPIEGAASFVVNHKAYGSVVGLLPLTLPGLDTLGKIDQLEGKITLSDEPLLELTGIPKKGEDSKALAEDLDSLRAKLRLASFLLPG
ncbi:MAG: hypothetical protein JRI68_29625, partial [Deltaproteobacteria bacterium]|nr:hypothetical protein [Deltaproteobacteria bacterium]